MIVDIVYGFLGSGKTTFITKVLAEWGGQEKVVVLVNEFGEVGIDGELLKGQGGNVVEMPSGCICCTLQADFKMQMLDIVSTIKPERLIIEPTGVATIAQIQSIVAAQMFENVIKAINQVLIVDATGFMGLYKANPHFVESQVRNARIVLLNKCDRVEKRRAMLTRDALSAINPNATVLMTEFGAVDWQQYKMALSKPLVEDQTDWRKVPAAPHGLLETVEPALKAGGELHLHEEEDALGYESYGLVFDDVTFDSSRLEDLFRLLNQSSMGEVVRAKGIFRLKAKTVLMELASGEFSSQPVRAMDQSKVAVIGRKLDRKRIGSAFERCVSSESDDS
ncbi:MAG: GTP-binding protein [Deltaproteobacteria bacterium]|nr:GTP-binding protein [Deltaproteobacteria bacterium]